jgi:thiamine-monophosphate kinase
MEFDLIERIRRRAPTRDDVRLGIGDDAALLRVPAGHDLVVTADTLNAGIHFPHWTAASDIGWKSLAVNLSDLAAMGASPAWCTLSLSLPQADPAWLDAFLDGFLALAREHEVALVGGDTTRGPLSIAVTAHGVVPYDTALRRAGATPGDEIWITGTPGDAAGALALSGVAEPAPPAPAFAALRARLERPTPRVAAGIALRGLASACIDVSDGVLADLAHLLRASGTGARIDLDRLPMSAALHAAFRDVDARLALQLGGGDDYELCFTAPATRHETIADAMRANGTPATVIGQAEAATGTRVFDAHGKAWTLARPGWDHFAKADS